MKLLWIGGDHPRHLFYINTIHEMFPLSGAIVEHRENLIPQAAPGLAPRDRENFDRHFSNRAKAEQRFFGDQSVPDCPTHVVGRDGLNTRESADFLTSIDPDVVLIFGSGLVKEPLYSSLPPQTINLHLGISPRYRGAATLFWPFYFLEPPYAGTTFHYIVAEPDAGDVIHQVVPELDVTDGIHDVACKAVVASAQAALELLRILDDKGRWERFSQRGTGRNFLASDFKPEHLRVIYNIFDDDMVRHYLEGRLTSKVPKLMRQF
jgi:folate-dependent phosphoribosylglycinamide formyltransferase PurN